MLLNVSPGQLQTYFKQFCSDLLNNIVEPALQGAVSWCKKAYLADQMLLFCLIRMWLPDAVQTIDFMAGCCKYMYMCRAKFAMLPIIQRPDNIVHSCPSSQSKAIQKTGCMNCVLCPTLLHRKMWARMIGCKDWAKYKKYYRFAPWEPCVKREDGITGTMRMEVTSACASVWIRTKAVRSQGISKHPFLFLVHTTCCLQFVWTHVFGDDKELVSSLGALLWTGTGSTSASAVDAKVQAQSLQQRFSDVGLFAW